MQRHPGMVTSSSLAFLAALVVAPRPSCGWSTTAGTAVAFRRNVGRRVLTPDYGRRGDFRVSMSLSATGGGGGGGGDGDGDREEDDDAGAIYFDDFGDQVIGGSTASAGNNAGGRDPASSRGKNVPLSLSSRMQEVAERQEARSRENWRRGNWNVRGLSLDPESARAAAGDSESDSSGSLASETAKIHVCLVAPDPSESGRIWVGRTDGSVLAVQLGDEFLTSFRSQLAATFDEGTGSAQVTSRLVNNNDQAPGSGRASDEDDEDESKGSFSGTGTPFELEFQGSVGSSPVSCLLVDREQLLFSSCRGSSDVQQWKIVDASDNTIRLEPLALLRGAHGPDSNVVMLKTAIDAYDPAKRNVLVSVAQDGSLGLWDLDSGGAMLGHFQIRAEDPTEQGSHLLSADSDGTRVFVGTSRGQVLAFAVHDLIANARGSASSPCPVPNGLWVASVDHPITAIACSGPGTLGTTQDGGTLPANASVGLITGDGSGTVRQWEIVTRTTQVASDDAGSRPATKLEHWPRLSTQRLPKRAHVFQRMHEGPVTALLSVDSTKLLSASGDGSVVAWNPVSGKSYFFLDGFESDLRSLCVQENTLVTDGMKHLVCVHDFNIDELEPDDNDDSLSDRFDVW